MFNALYAVVEEARGANPETSARISWRTLADAAQRRGQAQPEGGGIVALQYVASADALRR